MSAVTRRVDTFRLYSWTACPVFSHYANRRRSRDEIRRFVTRVWEQDGRAGWPCPTVTFKRPSDPFFDGWPEPTSYYNSGSICLIPIHMDYAVTLHELTHAKGFGTHGPGFVREYLRLLAKWARMDPAETELSMRAFGIRLPRLAPPAS